MLSIPTLWTASVVNFLALGLIWAYVSYSYPKLVAARFWTAAAFTAAAGAALGTLRFVTDTPMPLVAAGTVLIFAGCVGSMGIQRFYDRKVTWGAAALLTGLCCAALLFFSFAQDSMPGRILVYSLGQSLSLGLALNLLLTRQDNRSHPGARLAGVVTVLIITIYLFRPLANLLQIGGGGFSFVDPNPVHSVLVLMLMFLSMTWNFGFLLMAIDRLRDEVADLALLDDLTGVANRRHLLLRLSEECAKSERSREPFSLLVIDLDGFKLINDTYGHAAGDACLQHFTLMAQTRLRPYDLLARTGGDEFCIVLPTSTVREGAMIARRVLEVCRADAEACTDMEIPIGVSIGVAQWTQEIGQFPDRIMATADHALYAAKKEGKNRCAVYDPAPPLAPAPESQSEAAPKKHARTVL
jgi:diguanylate cyclase (GGDEF)-like protein